MHLVVYKHTLLWFSENFNLTVSITYFNIEIPISLHYVLVCVLYFLYHRAIIVVISFQLMVFKIKTLCDLFKAGIGCCNIIWMNCVAYVA